MANEWREHIKLKGHFLADRPDDLQVIVHDGGPRFTTKTPELLWVTVIGVEADVFRARVVNPPQHLQSVQPGDEIFFIVPEKGAHPIRVSVKYLGERQAWLIHPCGKCGLSELADAPSDLIHSLFPKIPPGARLNLFTAECPMCGGIQCIRSAAGPVSFESEPPAAAQRPWWKLWQ